MRRPASPWRAKGEAERRAERMAEADAAAACGNYDEAQSIWIGCAHLGNVRAQARIGECFIHGWGVERNVQLARHWLALAANSADPLGQRLLGDYFFHGEEGRPEPTIAEEWYARAAAQGDPRPRICCPGY